MRPPVLPAALAVLALAAGPAAAWGSKCYTSYDDGSSSSYTAKSGTSSNSGATAPAETTTVRK